MHGLETAPNPRDGKSRKKNAQGMRKKEHFMKKLIALFSLPLLAAAVLAGCASVPRGETMPEWVTSHRTVYPDGEYLAQRGSGNFSEAAQTDAMSQIARYFKTSVNANLSTTMQSISSGASVDERLTVVDDVRVSSEVSLFALECTVPYYHKKEKRWYCVAYIRRAEVWKQYKPQIDGALKTFIGQYESAVGEADPFMRISKCKTAWDAGGTLLEKLEYGRIISPKDEAAYSGDRDKIAQIPVMAEAAKKECTVFVDAPDDYNRTLTQAVSTALSTCGLTVAKTADGAAYTASVEIDDGASGSDPVSITPAVSVKITGKGGNSVYSFETAAKEKAVAYTLENAKKKAYPALAKEIEDALQKDLGVALKL